MTKFLKPQCVLDRKWGERVDSWRPSFKYPIDVDSYRIERFLDHGAKFKE